jgi:hypothetical protein
VTGRFGIVTERFGNVTGDFGAERDRWFGSSELGFSGPVGVA